MTPKSAWENIQHLIPKDKLIWEAFYGDGTSGAYLHDLGFNVIHEEVDFFENNLGDIVVSNPAFSKSKEVLTRLKELEKPFILILPSSKINTQYVRENYKNEGLQIIIPRKRIQFIKNGNELQNKCNFDCFYYCYKMDLPKDIIWLE
jgi:vacuolar-type H+-ATPase subunit F/Vma7